MGAAAGAEEMDSTSGIRSFIALELSEEVRRRMGRLQSRLKSAGFSLGWVEPESMHLTLFFLGHVDSSVLESIYDVSDAAAAAVAPFVMELQGVGYFGPRSNPRVVWVGVNEPTGALQRLYEDLASRLAGLGFEKEKRLFTPHVTLARVRPRHRASGLAAELEKLSGERVGVVRVARMVVMRSVLEPSGAVYTMLHESPMKGAD